ncbi:hypothetical protein SAMN05428945_4203 [Streptomyces sp. 2224.1]|uniref:DUF6193 family natural product biosynthesis protein n=1 Tax=unclassified Streptomyces TaxID=2593676 RepID=UPI00088CB9DB|nr:MULTISPECIES: DUF6193 family natural product biosynthesis protein [unclassified Streptomyces]PBC81271.1 hypothetical protein BX261_1134 [Streptomyces sp. 2321.6]SDR55775.1 hypothetical protein SAMN05216511_6082 [Streptomyces sp. KS_16]SEC08292.1 hypothetical protein SAMN05428940_1133 [Streptomyces sp. 2133.1]SED21354.1 hypothetical protein SAMN05428945_4203 [Streptomyces sp. 2224.1]SEF09076.1 hypothetical protein SAMN05428954_6144 [Streptomyces sp. 2112.3]
MTQNIEPQMPDEVAIKWDKVRAASEGRLIQPAVEAAYADPLLRMLFPMISHGSLHFSRCIKFPWTNDVPSIYPAAGEGFRVVRMNEPVGSSRQMVGDADSAEGAVALVVANLPSGCGPAIDGTADDLDRP